MTLQHAVWVSENTYIIHIPAVTYRFWTLITCSIQTLLPVLQFDFPQHVGPFLNINPTQETLGSLVLVLQSSPTSSGVLIIPKFPKVSKQSQVNLQKILCHGQAYSVMALFFQQLLGLEMAHLLWWFTVKKTCEIKQHTWICLRISLLNMIKQHDIILYNCL